jgi:hypothetical protein
LLENDSGMPVLPGGEELLSGVRHHGSHTSIEDFAYRVKRTSAATIDFALTSDPGSGITTPLLRASKRCRLARDCAHRQGGAPQGGAMRRTWWATWAIFSACCVAGCSTGPLMENPLFVRPDKLPPQDNPLYVPQGPMSYAKLYTKVLDIVDDFWEVAYPNRYEGRIETFPSIAPGLEQPWKPGSPDFYQRLYAYFQTVRHRCIVLITTADDGGYFIEVRVLKELEDLPMPIRATAGMASFRNPSTVERQFEVIEPGVYEMNWIPIGRDYKLEQVLLQKIAQCKFNDPASTVPSQ